MVRTTSDILDINPLERMEKLEEVSSERIASLSAKKKELEDLEKKKKQEIEELDAKKKKELDDLDKKKRSELDEIDKKRKEFAELEAQKLKEIEETRDLIEKSFQELMLHKRIVLEEDEKRKRRAEQVSLEEVTIQNAPPADKTVKTISYSAFFEGMQTPDRLNDVANTNFYNGLTELRNKAALGQMTPQEAMFVQKLKDQFDKFNSNEVYMQKDRDQYIERSIGVINQIENYNKNN